MVFAKAVVGLLLRRRPLYPAELRMHEQTNYREELTFCQSMIRRGDRSGGLAREAGREGRGPLAGKRPEDGRCSGAKGRKGYGAD